MSHKKNLFYTFSKVYFFNGFLFVKDGPQFAEPEFPEHRTGDVFSNTEPQKVKCGGFGCVCEKH